MSQTRNIGTICRALRETPGQLMLAMSVGPTDWPLFTISGHRFPFGTVPTEDHLVRREMGRPG